MDWQPIETAPKDGTPFIALNQDLEVWCAKYSDGNRLCFRTNKLDVSTTHDHVDVDGETRLVLDETKTTEKWRNAWTLWTRCYEFKPTHWLPLPSPPESKET